VPPRHLGPVLQALVRLQTAERSCVRVLAKGVRRFDRAFPFWEKKAGRFSRYGRATLNALAYLRSFEARPADRPLVSEWEDCIKIVPYFDYQGKLQFSHYSQRRTALRTAGASRNTERDPAFAAA
jgi:hypothetical protein